MEKELFNGPISKGRGVVAGGKKRRRGGAYLTKMKTTVPPYRGKNRSELRARGDFFRHGNRKGFEPQEEERGSFVMVEKAAASSPGEKKEMPVGTPKRRSYPDKVKEQEKRLHRGGKEGATSLSPERYRPIDMIECGGGPGVHSGRTVSPVAERRHGNRDRGLTGKKKKKQQRRMRKIERKNR